MFPYNLMPDPRGAKRLVSIGCKIKFKKTEIKVPIEVDTPNDYIPGTRYPKSTMKTVWLVLIQIPTELMDDIKQGSIDLADQTIDLDELNDSYDEDLDTEDEDGDAPDADMPMDASLAPPAPTM
jgi:hypothetical protein